MTFVSKVVSVDSVVIFELIKKVDEMEALIETLEIQSDANLMEQLEQTKKEHAAKTSVKTKEELANYLRSLG